MSWFLISLVNIFFVVIIHCQINLQPNLLQCIGPRGMVNPFIKLIIAGVPKGWAAELVLADIPFEVNKIAFHFDEPVQIYLKDGNTLFELTNSGGMATYIYNSNKYLDSCTILVTSKYTTFTPKLIMLAVNEGIHICPLLLVIPATPTNYPQNVGNIPNQNNFNGNPNYLNANPNYFNDNSKHFNEHFQTEPVMQGYYSSNSWSSTNGNPPDITSNSYSYDSRNGGLTGETYDSRTGERIVYSSGIPNRYNDEIRNDYFLHSNAEQFLNNRNVMSRGQRRQEIPFRNPSYAGIMQNDQHNNKNLYTTQRPINGRSSQNLASDRIPENNSPNNRDLENIIGGFSDMHINSNKSTQNGPVRIMVPTSTVDYRGIQNVEPITDHKVSESKISMISISSPLDLSICGRRSKTYKALISDGYSTRPGDWPWHAAIFHISITSSKEEYKCGGSLIAKNVILTAAHCIYEGTSRLINNRLIVRLGLHNRLGMDSNVQEFHIQEAIAHENFNITNLKNDIAILVLKEMPRYNDYVRPVCLWLKNQQLAGIRSSEGKEGYVIGFGSDGNQEIVNELAEARMPVFSHEDCLDRHTDFYNKHLSSSTFCAGFRNGTSVCNGDSGGGLFIDDDDNKIFRIRGIVSLSMITESNNRHCSPNEFVIFTNVAKYLDWLENTIGI